MSVLEAMSCGCGIVSTNTCMLSDIIEHGKDGYLCSPRKPYLFRKYIIELLEDKDKAKEFGENARKKVQKMFSIDRFVSEWKDLIKKVICKN
jgi:glycosyltransferase involved in cell wall biosynthesis